MLKYTSSCLGESINLLEHIKLTIVKQLRVYGSGVYALYLPEFSISFNQLMADLLTGSDRILHVVHNNGLLSRDCPPWLCTAIIKNCFKFCVIALYHF